MSLPRTALPSEEAVGAYCVPARDPRSVGVLRQTAARVRPLRFARYRCAPRGSGSLLHARGTRSLRFFTAGEDVSGHESAHHDEQYEPKLRSHGSDAKPRWGPLLDRAVPSQARGTGTPVAEWQRYPCGFLDKYCWW